MSVLRPDKATAAWMQEGRAEGWAVEYLAPPPMPAWVRRALDPSDPPPFPRLVLFPRLARLHRRLR